MYTRDDILVKIDGVTKKFGNKFVLAKIDTEIRDLHCSDRGRVVGQCVGLVGASGSGKSTLLNIMAGLEPPTSGKVILDGSTEHVQAGQVGVVFQGYPIFHNRTVMGNLLLAAKMGGLSDKESSERASQYLEAFEIAASDGKRYPAELSGGMRQRCALIRQLLLMDGNKQKTRLLLMDEPFSALDSHRVRKTCQTIRKVADSTDGTTVVVVTHDLRAALSICDLLWILKPTPTGSVIAKVMDRADSEMPWNAEAYDSEELRRCEMELGALL